MELKEMSCSYVAIVSAVATADMTTAITSSEKASSSNQDHDLNIVGYISACENLINDPSLASFDHFSALMIRGNYGSISSDLVGQGMVLCSRFLDIGDAALSILAQCLVLRHWLILPEYVRVANPKIIMTCFRGLRKTLESPTDVPYSYTSTLLMLWSQNIESDRLNQQERFYIFTTVLDCACSSKDLTKVSHTTYALRIIFNVFANSSEQIRMIMANAVVESYFREAIPTEYVSTILTMFVAICGHGCTSDWIRASNPKDMDKLSSLAHKAQSKAISLATTVAKKVIDEFMNKGASSFPSVRSLVDYHVQYLWSEQIASAEPFLTAIAEETSARSFTNDSNGEQIVAIIAHLHESLWFLLGSRMRITCTRLVAAARTRDQMHYLKTRLIAGLEPCSINDRSITTSTGVLLLPSEWRCFVLSSGLPQCYESLLHYLMKLVLQLTLSSSLQVRIFQSLKYFVQHDARFFPIMILERFRYSSENTCKALVPLASAAFYKHQTKSIKILESLGVRLRMPGWKSYKMAVGKFLCEAAHVSLEARCTSFHLMLTILADSDQTLWRVVSDAAQKILLEALSVDTLVGERSCKILRAVANSQDLVKTGLRTLTALMTPCQSKHLDLLMYKLCKTNELELVSLLSQFCDVRVPRDYILSIIEPLEPALSPKRTLQLGILASALKTENKCCSLDPLSSHIAFTKLYDAFTTSEQNNSDEVDYMAIALRSLIGICHPKVEEQRKAALQQFVDAIITELSKFKSFETDMFSSKHEHFSRMVQLLGCHKFWTFIRVSYVTDVINLLLCLSDSVSLGSIHSCLLVQVIFGIISRRKVPGRTKQAVMNFASKIVYSIPETDVLIGIILRRKWIDEQDDANSSFFRGGFFGLHTELKLLERMLYSETVFPYRTKFEYLSRTLHKQPILQDYCLPKIISFCFAHNATTAQWALENYSNMRKQKRFTTSKVILGLQLAASLERRHIGPFPRVWELTTYKAEDSNVLDLVEQLVATISSDGDTVFLKFVFDGLVRTNMDSVHGLWLKEKLSVMIARCSVSASMCTQLSKVQIMQTLENFLAQKYLLSARNYSRELDAETHESDGDIEKPKVIKDEALQRFQ